MASKQPPQPRKRPRQRRSAHLVEAIQQACLQILQLEGPDSLTTQRIADVAGVGIGSLYQYFPNKEAVVAEVFQQEIAENAQAALADVVALNQQAERSLDHAVRCIIDKQVEQLQRCYELEPDFFRKYREQLDPRSIVEALTLAREQPSLDDWFIAVLQHHAASLRVDDIPLAGFLALRALDGALSATVAEQPDRLADEAYRQQLFELLIHYLRGEESTG